MLYIMEACAQAEKCAKNLEAWFAMQWLQRRECITIADTLDPA